MAYSPIVIDELLRRVHSHLSAEDECYSMMVYTSHRGYTYSVENSLISNFKKGLDLKGTAQWTYKGREIGKLLKDILPQIVDLDTKTIVPPSPKPATMPITMTGSIKS